MPDINIKADVKQTSTLGKVKVLVEQVVGSPSQESINQAVASYIDSHPGALSPLSQATKSALLQIAEKVAYIDEHGEDYYDALDAALSAKALLSITAVYTQSGTVYDTDSLDSLKSDLVVTAYYDDGSTANVTAVSELSGTLAEGTSTITVTYGGKTATFDVTVSVKVPVTVSVEGNNKSLNESASVGTSYTNCKKTNSNRYRTVNPVEVSVGDVINFSASGIGTDVLGAYFLWFDANQNYTGVHSSAWDYSGSYTVDKNYPYLGISFRTQNSQGTIAGSSVVLNVTVE